jgi:hypothetical protein
MASVGFFIHATFIVCWILGATSVVWCSDQDNRRWREGLDRDALAACTEAARRASASALNHLPKALLTAALLERLSESAGRETAAAHVAEAEKIATRRPMPFSYLANVCLAREPARKASAATQKRIAA